MSFSVIPLEQALTPVAYADFKSVLGKLPPVDRALDNRAWICGGFARHMMLNRPAKDYFTNYHAPGDVDVFFNSSEDARAGIPKSARRSLAGFAKDLQGKTKVQFVDDPGLIRPTIEETLSNFDIVNCRVAMNHQSVVVSDDWQDIEDKKLLRIGRNDTPFLASRILKYLNYRGLDGLTDDSYEQLTGWFAHAANNFNDKDWSSHHLAGVEYSVKKLRDRGILQKKDLIFFIGKWKKEFKDRSYGGSVNYSVDWALNELGTI
jgi:hypothetical protein